MNQYESGLRVAVSRGDIDLAKTCHSHLQNDPQRLSILLRDICLTECFYLLAERGESWPFLKKLVWCPTNKDAKALVKLIQLDFESEHREYMLARKVREYQPREIVKTFLKSRSKWKPDAYVSRLLDCLLEIADGNESVLTKQTALIAIILLRCRRPKGGDIKSLIKGSCTGKPRGVKGAIPWYAYDPKGEIVQVAISLLRKSHRDYSEEQLNRLWLLFETNQHKRSKPVSDQIKVQDEIWWPQYVKTLGKRQRALWKGLRADAEKAINRVIS